MATPQIKFIPFNIAYIIALHNMVPTHLPVSLAATFMNCHFKHTMHHPLGVFDRGLLFVCLWCSFSPSRGRILCIFSTFRSNVQGLEPLPNAFMSPQHSEAWTKDSAGLDSNWLLLLPVSLGANYLLLFHLSYLIYKMKMILFIVSAPQSCVLAA
jgi:hypothetical protein